METDKKHKLLSSLNVSMIEMSPIIYRIKTWRLNGWLTAGLAVDIIDRPRSSQSVLSHTGKVLKEIWKVS